MLLGGVDGFSLLFMDCADAIDTPARTSAAEAASARICMTDLPVVRRRRRGTNLAPGTLFLAAQISNVRVRARNFSMELSLSVDDVPCALAESTRRDWDLK